MKIKSLKLYIKKIFFTAVAVSSLGMLAACGEAKEPVAVDAEGNYSFQEIDEVARYVIEIYHAEDVDTEAGTINEDAKYVTRKSFSTSVAKKGNSTSFSSVPYGDYVPVIYGIYSDRKTTTDKIFGETYTVGGKLTAPDVMVTNKGLGAIVRIKQNSMDNYLNKEARYSFTAEVYSDADCKNEVTEVTFGEKAEVANNTFYRFHTGEFNVTDAGTYYVRVKANGNEEKQVEDSDYSDVVEIALDADVDDSYSVDFTLPKEGDGYNYSELSLDFIFDLMWHKGFVFDTENELSDGEFLDFTVKQQAGNGETVIFHLLEDGTLYLEGPSQIPVDLVSATGKWEEDEAGNLSIHVDATDYNTAGDDELSEGSAVKGSTEISNGWGA